MYRIELYRLLLKCYLDNAYTMLIVVLSYPCINSIFVVFFSVPLPFSFPWVVIICHLSLLDKPDVLWYVRL